MGRTKRRDVPMKCPICDEELEGTEAHCPTCAWDLHRKPSAFLFVVFGIVALCALTFACIKAVAANHNGNAGDVCGASDSLGDGNACQVDVQEVLPLNFDSNNNVNQTTTNRKE